jgi:3D-(3,5/4)-trihydroxycyclohexane-1,2-dione acylhydrolase (decyclizing)
LRGDALRCLQRVDEELGRHAAEGSWVKAFRALREDWNQAVMLACQATGSVRPGDAEVLGVVNRVFDTNATVVCAAGGLPGELHKLWRAADADSYHVEYGYSCMGYEIAGGLGVKMALPQRDVVVMLGDGSYLMMNSEISTSVALGLKLIIILLDNHGFGCINRLQTSLGGRGYNNLWESSYEAGHPIPAIDFAQHAAALGARAEKVTGLAGLEPALRRARQSDRTSVVVIETDPLISTGVGGTWWDVPVAEVSESELVTKAAEAYRGKLRDC